MQFPIPIFEKSSKKSYKKMTVKYVYKMINTKYEVNPTLELGYLGVKKNVFDFFKAI